MLAEKGSWENESVAVQRMIVSSIADDEGDKNDNVFRGRQSGFICM